MLCAVLLALAAQAAPISPSQQSPQSESPPAATKAEQHNNLGDNTQRASSTNKPDSNPPVSVKKHTTDLEDAANPSHHENDGAKALPWINAGLTLLMVMGTLLMAYATFRLAENANTQVGLLNQYVGATDRMAEATAKAARETQSMVGAAFDSLEVAKRQVDIAARQLDAMDRPWLQVSAEAQGGITFDPHSGRAQFPLLLVIENSGRSVARRLNFRTALILSSLPGLDRSRIGEEQGKTAKSALEQIAGDEHSGTILFPGEFVRVPPDEDQLSAEQIGRNIITTFSVPFIKVLFVGSVVYCSPHSDMPHYTNFAFEIGGKKDETSGYASVITHMQDIPMECVTFHRLWGNTSAT